MSFQKCFTPILNILMCALFFSIALLPSTVEAANLYALLIGDTEDSNLGYAFQQDLDLMHKEVKKIAKETGLTLNVSLFQGWQVTPEKVLQQIEELKIHSDDVLILYFTIHGYRTESKESRWPNLFFGLEQRGVDFDYINQIVKGKNPRLLLSIADSCNNTLPDGLIPTIQQKALPVRMPNSAKVKANYKKLFLESAGTIIISGSIPGQYSWAYTYLGGIYTLNFVEALKESVYGKKPADWQTLLDKAAFKVSEAVIELNETQTPQYDLQLTSAKGF
jgi:hypothetical protein